MDYESYFGLKEKPFSVSPDERFYYDSPQHSKTILKLLHTAEESLGLGILVGDIGAGKTTISRRMLDILSSKDDFEVALLVIIHSEITPEWFLKKIAFQLGIEEDLENENKVALITMIYKQLTKIYEEGKKTVVMIDEANMLKNKDIFEEMRGLLNIEMEGKHLITFILFGLAELDENIKLDEPLHQRIVIRCKLEPLDIKSTMAYINHRLRVAGRDDDTLFEKSAIDEIYQYSKGKPRIINIICENALLEGFLRKRSTISKDIIASVAQDLGLE